MRRVARPHQESYFLAGKVAGKTTRFLLDTGCTTNLLSKSTYDKLSEKVKGNLEPADRIQGMVADGSPLRFFGTIKLSFRIKSLVWEERVLVAQIKDEAILGMPFLVQHGCTLSFKDAVLVAGEHELPCQLQTGEEAIQAVRVAETMTRGPVGERVLRVQVESRTDLPITGVIEGLLGKGIMAATLTTLEQGTGWVRVFDNGSLPLNGQVIGKFTPVKDEDILPGWPAVLDDQPKEPQVGAHTGDWPAHLTGLLEQTKDTCNKEEQQEQIRELLTKYQDVFSRGEGDTGQTDLIQHDIPLEAGTRPIRQPARRLGAEREAEVEAQVDKLLKQGVIEPGTGAWSSPVVVVRKKDGTWRFCVDYRRLNAVTVQDAYPLPRIDESLEALAGSSYFSTLDLLSGYWQVPLSADARDKAAFVTRGGLWRWKVLPFGLTSAPATFQRLMEQVLRGLHWKTLLLYLDDIIVMAPDFQTHKQRLAEVLDRLRSAGLKLKPGKCYLFQKEVEYLGHRVSAEGIATDPGKIEAVNKWPSPKGATDLRAFLGLAGYRQYMPDFATVAKPLHRLTGKGTLWSWEKDEEDSFKELKRRLVSAPVLRYPDPSLEFILDTDASNVGLGAVLSQRENGEERVVAYYSKTLAPPEKITV